MQAVSQSLSGSPHSQPNPPFDLVSTVHLQARHNRTTGQKTIFVIYSGTMPGTNSHQSPETSSLVALASVGMAYSALCRPQPGPPSFLLCTNILANPHSSYCWRLQRSVTVSCLRHGPYCTYSTDKKL